MSTYRWLGLCLACGCLLLPLSGCGGGGNQRFVSMGTSPLGGTLAVIGNALTEVLNDNKGQNTWKVQPRGTNGSQDNIRQLVDRKLQLALSNSSITYFAVRGEEGWEKPYDVRAMMTLSPMVGMFLTTADSGIKSIADMKGKRVAVGPEGAGFEMFLNPIFKEHGLTYDDFEPLKANFSASVDLLADGSADAVFMGGAGTNNTIAQACNSLDIYFIPYDPMARERLIEKYPFFNALTVKKGTYDEADQKSDIEALNVGSMQLITAAAEEDEFIYQLTKTLYEHRQDVAEKHPVGKTITPENAPRYTGVDFHPGAIKFYKEAGIWPADKGDAVAAKGGDEAVPAEAKGKKEPAPKDEPAPKAD